MTVSPYDQVVSRKRKWTPVAVRKGDLVSGSEDAFFRALALRSLELPVADFLRQGLKRNFPRLLVLLRLSPQTSKMRNAMIKPFVMWSLLMALTQRQKQKDSTS